MIVLRLLRVGLHILSGLLICTLVFPWLSAGARQARIGRWSTQLLRLFRVRLEVITVDAADVAAAVANDSAVPGQRSVVVANHVSWLDIFVINAMHPCRFVAKSDIRDWPVLGTLCVKSDTIFISRGSTRDVRKTFKNLVASIDAGDRIAFFPEGTTAAQGTLLPFHANLFEAAIDAAVPVQPLALRYLDATDTLHAGVDYVGDTTFWQSMLVILRGPALRAQILVLPTIAVDGSDRRSVARLTHRSIAQALGYAETAGA